VRADALLARLRAPGETGYKIPRGFLFEEVSCPNYLGEIVEWVGWALAAWVARRIVVRVLDGGGTSFRARAGASPAGTRERFPDYPPGRRAIVPADAS